MTRPAAPTTARAKHAPGARRTPFVLLLAGLVLGGLCALLALNTASAANEVQRHDLALRDQNIAARVVQLHNDQQASAAPANLARAAEALGMVPAGNPGFLEINSAGHVHVAGKAAPATAAPLPAPTPTHSDKPKKSTPKKSTPKKSTPKSTPKKSTTSPKKSGDQPDKKSGGNTGAKTNKKTDQPDHQKQHQKQHQTQHQTQHQPGKHRTQSHRTQSHGEQPADPPTTTITMPGGPR